MSSTNRISPASINGSIGRRQFLCVGTAALGGMTCGSVTARLGLAAEGMSERPKSLIMIF